MFLYESRDSSATGYGFDSQQRQEIFCIFPLILFIYQQLHTRQPCRTFGLYQTDLNIIKVQNNENDTQELITKYYNNY
jgi:hypothetical protein